MTDLNSLYMMAQGHDSDPFGAFFEGRRIKQNDTVMQNKLAELARMDQARPLMGRALQGDSSALEGLAGLDPSSYMDVRKYQTGQQAAQREISDDEKKRIAGALLAADTPEKWAQTIDYLEKQGHQVDPDERDFNNRDAFLGMQGVKPATGGGFNLSPGQTRYDAAGNVVAQNGGQDGAGRPPSGFRWTSDGNLEPIKGGPQDPAVKGSKNARLSPMPAELASRIGLAEDFGRQYPAIRKAVEEGAFGEPELLAGSDNLAKRRDMLLRRGQQGEILREIKGGSEALTRMLTGAGMNVGEAQNEVQQYLPEASDTTATVLSKMDMLKRRLDSMVERASAGRVQPNAVDNGQQDNPVYSGADGITEADLPTVMTEAEEAISAGADPQAVIDRLIEMGVDPNFAGTLISD
jgi:hypothetical protein